MDMMNPLVLENIPMLLERTICHEHGRFRSLDWNASNDALIRDWELRLIYLALHRHFHEPAWKELKSRTSSNSCNSQEHLERNFGVQKYDYECQDAKFLVTSIATLGSGALLRLGAVPNILMGLASDRIPLFLARTGVGPQFLREGWTQASCDRRNMQCVFLPVSPCVITNQDLENATVMEEIYAMTN